MSMEINGSYNQSKTIYAEQMEEKQAFHRAEKAGETSDETDGKGSVNVQDEYISSEKSVTKSVGIYRIGQDENGRRKIFFDDPQKSGCADGEKQPKASGDDPGKPVEKCIGNTDRVEREIKKLKEEKRQLEQQIRSASGDEKKMRELEKKLAQIENELSRKDNETYRRQNTSFSK